jgi:pilus assembly protein CpaF
MTTINESMTALLQDDSITEILVDGPDQVYVERTGKLEGTDVRFANEQEIINWANSLLASHGWEPLGERPWIEGRLRDGSRVVVVVPPVAVKGPSIVIRKFLRVPLTFDQLLEYGSVDKAIVSFLETVMQAKLNVLVSGGTASGKTTLTNMIVELVPEEERLIAVEQMNDLRLRNKRAIYLEAHAASVKGAGEVTVSDLLWVAARMRPDRIIVGELVGVEALDVLQLMKLGHEGMVTIIHASSPRDALARLEKMATIAEPSLTLPVIRAEIASAIDLIVQASRLEDGSRKVTSVAEVQDIRGDNIVLQEIFTWEKTGVGADGRVTGAFRATGAIPSFAATLEAMGLTFPKDIFNA